MLRVVDETTRAEIHIIVDDKAGLEIVLGIRLRDFDRLAAMLNLFLHVKDLLELTCALP